MFCMEKTHVSDIKLSWGIIREPADSSLLLMIKLISQLMSCVAGHGRTKEFYKGRVSVVLW